MIFRRRPRKSPPPEPEPPKTSFIVSAARVLVEVLDHADGVPEILCVPSRDGALVVALAQVLPHSRITGIDPRTESCRVAAEMALEEGIRGRVEFRPAPLRRLPLADGIFPLVVAPGLLAGEANPDLVLKEIARVIAVGGQMLLLEPSEGPWPPAVSESALRRWVEASPLQLREDIAFHPAADGPGVFLAHLHRT